MKTALDVFQQQVNRDIQKLDEQIMAQDQTRKKQTADPEVSKKIKSGKGQIFTTQAFENKITRIMAEAEHEKVLQDKLQKLSAVKQ